MLSENNFNSDNNTPQQPKGVNIKELFLKYLHYAWLFALTLTCSIAIAWLYLRYTKPMYSVSATLLIRNDNANRSGGAMNSQDMFSDIALFQSATNKQNEILILSSRTMMERVVKSLGLQKKYSVVANVKTTDIYPDQPFELQILELKDSTRSFAFEIHFTSDWRTFRLGDSKKDWLTGEEIETSNGKFKIITKESVYTHLAYRDFIVQWMPIEVAATSYLNGLSVKPANDLSNVLSISYINENPLIATAITNELMSQYNKATIEDKNETNRKILAFINDRLFLVENQLDSVEGNLQRLRTSKQIIDLSAQSQLYFGNISQLNEALRIQEVQLQVAELLEQYINQPSNRLSLVPSTLGLTDLTLIELTASYNKLVAERLSQLQTGATLNNPVIKNLERNIEEARLKIVQNLQNIKQVYRNSITTLKQKSESINKEITAIPEKQRQSSERARQQEIKQNLYLYLMQKREASEIAQASTIASSRILDFALPIFNKVSPIPTKTYSIALLLGLVLPILIIYLRDLFNDKVTTRSDITNVTNAPILGEIGHSTNDKVLLFPDSSRSIVAEQMRILRSNLRFVLAEKLENATIVVTSSFSAEGKSFISTNLGATMAISGKKTVILEFDLRKPKILAGLGLSKSNGLTNYLVGSAQLPEIVQQVPQIENLFVISCGPVPPNPSEILLSPKIAELFLWLKKNFDTVIVDTAPAGLVSDAFTLSQYADSTIYVIRQRYTFKRQINFIEDLYKEKKLPNMGLLVNDVVSEGSKGYYGYGGGRYGYGYGYGYGYAESYFDSSNKRNGIYNIARKIFKRS